MSLKDQILEIADRLKNQPVDAVIKVMMVFMKPMLDSAAAETNEHYEKSQNYPEGSQMRSACLAKYNETFARWHKLSYLEMKLKEAIAFQGLGQSHKRVSKAA